MRLASRRVAAAAIFATLYAVLRLVPVSPLIGVRGSLTMGEVFSPLAGMVLGPLVGGLSILLGTFITVILGRPLVFDGLDFIPGVIASVTAGLAISSGAKWSALMSALLMIIFTADPLSAETIRVGQLPVPFLWMHILALLTMLVVWTTRGKGQNFNPLYVASTVFLSAMNAHVSGAIMFENVLVRVNASLTPSAIAGVWSFVFFIYPVERAFFTVVGSVLAISVLKTIPRGTLAMLMGSAEATKLE